MEKFVNNESESSKNLTKQLIEIRKLIYEIVSSCLHTIRKIRHQDLLYQDHQTREVTLQSQRKRFLCEEVPRKVRWGCQHFDGDLD